jgi:2-polyprenyl-3-methyl-5-hydroxy-6-metoxy-1,4-benzoquinol methylase
MPSQTMEKENSCRDKLYSNDGNSSVVRFLPSKVQRVLDVGCGAGDNAKLIKEKWPNTEVHGITLSKKEQKKALSKMEYCYLADIEKGVPEQVKGKEFDLILFSHVLEHLRSPSQVLKKFSSILSKNGSVVVAVPNVCVWPIRLQFLKGKFEYTDKGHLDRTHMRFFTYYTIDELFSDINALYTVRKTVSGHFPLGAVRRILSKKITLFIDRISIQMWPNLLGYQVLIEARRKPDKTHTY